MSLAAFRGVRTIALKIVLEFGLIVPIRPSSQAEDRLDRSAARIASCDAPACDTVDLSAEMVDLLQARTDFEASARLVRVAGDMSKQLLNLVA